LKILIFSSTSGSFRRRRGSSRNSSQRRNSKVEPKIEKKSKLTDTEDAATGAVGLDVYVRYFKSIGIFLGLGAILCNALQQAASVYSSSKLSLDSSKFFLLSIIKISSFLPSFSL
jgi:hypothetical protein